MKNDIGSTLSLIFFLYSNFKREFLKQELLLK